MLSNSALLTGLALLSGYAFQDPLAGWIAELNRSRDAVKPELIHKIAGYKSRRAMEALVRAYDLMKSIYARREIVRALVKFDGVAEAEQPALEKLATVVVSGVAPELRDAAFESLDACDHLGKHYLARIVDSQAPDDVRLKALRLHVKRASKDDVAWYRKIWNPKRELQKKGVKGMEFLEFEPIRELAFQGLAPFVSDAKIIDALRGSLNPKIRRAALDELENRDSPKSAEMAAWLFRRVDIPGPERISAMKIVAAHRGPKIVPTFIALAKKKVITPEDLRQAMAAQIVAFNDEATNKKMAKRVGHGKPHEKLFALWATRHLDDPKFLKRVRKGLKDKSFDVRRAAAQVLAERKDRMSVPLLRLMLDKPREPADMRVAVEAISTIENGSKEWIAKLRELCKSDVREVRNAALNALAQAKNTAYLPTLSESLRHPDWTTRLIAIRGLEELRQKEAVSALIARMPLERGRMALTMAEALWTLTGQPFGVDAGRWQRWWKDKAASFTVISKDELAKAEKARELRRLRQQTVVKGKFFGITIASHRVIFIIDTSGSMVLPVHGRMIGKRQATRIEVAKQELTQAIEDLAPNSLFNIFSFSLGVQRWLKEGIATSSEKTRKQALTWLERLGAGGPTNLYDAIKFAFEDPDVDTIFVLSDGEPNSGEEIDPHRIREDVKFWNQHRRIKIHTIAIGGNLDVLEWLAKDSGGDHVQIR